MESTGKLDTLLDQGRVERETLRETDLERAWEAISDPDVLERWLADEVEADLGMTPLMTGAAWSSRLRGLLGRFSLVAA